MCGGADDINTAPNEITILTCAFGIVMFISGAIEEAAEMDKEAKHLEIALYYVFLYYVFLRQSIRIWLLMRCVWRKLNDSLAFDTEMKVIALFVCFEAEMTLTPLLIKLQF